MLVNSAEGQVWSELTSKVTVAELHRREALEAQAVEAAACETDDEYHDEETITVPAAEAYGDLCLGAWVHNGPGNHVPNGRVTRLQGFSLAKPSI